jgi:hypothetical protein
MIVVQVGVKTECKIYGFYLFLDSIVNFKKKTRHRTFHLKNDSASDKN